MIKLGLCAPVNELYAAAQMGYDYIEPALCALAAEKEEVFSQYRSLVENAPIKPECFNILLPGTEITMIGDQADPDRLQGYLSHAFARAAMLHGKIAVWGSGAARRCPDGTNRQTAYRQLVQAGRIMANIAEQYGIIVVVEPLNPHETNMIVTLDEGAQLVQSIGHKHMRLLADLYHMKNVGDSLSMIGKYIDMIRHIHIADAIETDRSVRYFPAADDAYHTSECIEYLKGAGYTGRVSLECRAKGHNNERQDAFHAVRRWLDEPVSDENKK